MDRIYWSVDIDFNDEKESGFIKKRTGITTLTGQRYRGGKWLFPPVTIKLVWEFEFDQTDRRHRLTVKVAPDSSHEIIDLAGNVIEQFDTQNLIGLRNAIRRNPVDAPKTGQVSRRRSDMENLPKFIKVNGERYRLAAADEVTAGRKKKKNRGKRSTKNSPSIKASDRFDDQFYNGDAVEFDITILTKSRTGEELPTGSKKVGRSIPEDINSKLSPPQKVEAEKAKEKGELWYFEVTRAGWHWREKNPTSAVATIQKALDYIDKQKGLESPRVIYAYRLIKPIGFSSR